MLPFCKQNTHFAWKAAEFSGSGPIFKMESLEFDEYDCVKTPCFFPIEKKSVQHQTEEVYVVEKRRPRKTWEEHANSTGRGKTDQGCS